MRTAVCIATHERAGLLGPTLEALARQSCPPAEIVVSDSSAGEATAVRIAEFARAHAQIPVRYVRSNRKALPWQRWWAFRHSAGDPVLFLDDDVRLSPVALGRLEEAYSSVSPGGRVGGIGFVFNWEGEGPQPRRNTKSIKERWLGTARAIPGSLTPGGQTVSFFGLPRGFARVDALWGGAMSYPRAVLEDLSCLDRLVDLYEAGLGRGEDGVLSRYASRRGDLYLINEPLAFHPRERRGPAPYPRSGFTMGLAHTWGRAHTMRWMASDPGACRREWARLVTLEIGRSLSASVRRPLSGSNWGWLGGSLLGVGKAVLRWSSIPARAKSA